MNFNEQFYPLSPHELCSQTYWYSSIWILQILEQHIPRHFVSYVNEAYECFLSAQVTIGERTTTCCPSTKDRLLPGTQSINQSVNRSINLLLFNRRSYLARYAINQSINQLVALQQKIVSCPVRNQWSLKLNFRQYPAMHTNYSWSNCTYILCHILWLHGKVVQWDIM